MLERGSGIDTVVVEVETPTSFLGARRSMIRVGERERTILGTWGTSWGSSGLLSLSDTSTSLPRSRVKEGEGGGRGSGGDGDTGSDLISSSCWTSGTHGGGE